MIVATVQDVFHLNSASRHSFPRNPQRKTLLENSESKRPRLVLQLSVVSTSAATRELFVCNYHRPPAHIRRDEVGISSPNNIATAMPD